MHEADLKRNAIIHHGTVQYSHEEVSARHCGGILSEHASFSDDLWNTCAQHIYKQRAVSLRKEYAHTSL